MVAMIKYRAKSLSWDKYSGNQNMNMRKVQDLFSSKRNLQFINMWKARPHIYLNFFYRKRKFHRRERGNKRRGKKSSGKRKKKRLSTYT